MFSVAFSPDGHTLAASSADKTVRLWNVTNPRQPSRLGAPLAGPNNYVYSIAFSPDGHTLATGNTDDSVWLWNISDRRQPTAIAALPSIAGHIYGIAFSPDGNTIAAAGTNRIVQMWHDHLDQVAATVCSEE